MQASPILLIARPPEAPARAPVALLPPVSGNPLPQPV